MTITGVLAVVDELTAVGLEIRREHEAVCQATRSGLEHARTAGELLITVKNTALRHGEWLRFLAEQCPAVSPRVAQAYMRVARHWPAIEAAANTKQDSHLTLRDALKLLADGTPRQAHNTGDFEWYTPKDYIVAARAVLGAIDLDPASSEAANAVVQADRFYSQQDDGLAQEWRGRVWMNPPYANTLVSLFCEKLVDAVQAGRVPAAIVLANNCTETRWFAALTRAASGLCFPVGRVRFWKADQIVRETPLQGQAIVYFGSDVDRFCDVFAPIGVVAEIRRDLVREAVA